MMRSALALGPMMTIALLAATTAVAVVRSGPPRPGTCQLWEDRDMTGDRLDIGNGDTATFGEDPMGDTYWSERGDGWNDTISSLRSPRGCRLTVYEHAKGNGASRVYDGRTVYYVGDKWNDRISSAVCSCD
jgi:hypothetical protein